MYNTNEIAEEAVKLATIWQNRANALQTPQEKARHTKLARLFTNPRDKVILTMLIDQSFRSSDFGRVADQIQLYFYPVRHPDVFLASGKSSDAAFFARRSFFTATDGA